MCVIAHTSYSEKTQQKALTLFNKNPLKITSVKPNLYRRTLFVTLQLTASLRRHEGVWVRSGTLFISARAEILHQFLSKISHLVQKSLCFSVYTALY